MKHLICILFVTLLSTNAFAQDFEIVRNPMSQEEFKEFIYQKYSNFEKRKIEDKKLPKLKKEDMIEILSSVPFMMMEVLLFLTSDKLKGLVKEHYTTISINHWLMFSLVLKIFCKCKIKKQVSLFAKV